MGDSLNESKTNLQMLHPECYPHPQLIFWSSSNSRRTSVAYVGDIFWKFTIILQLLQMGESWFLSVCFVFAVSRVRLPVAPVFPGEWSTLNQTNTNVYQQKPTKPLPWKLVPPFQKWSLLNSYTFKWVVNHQLKNVVSLNFRLEKRTQHIGKSERETQFVTSTLRVVGGVIRVRTPLNGW